MRIVSELEHYCIAMLEAADDRIREDGAEYPAGAFLIYAGLVPGALGEEVCGVESNLDNAVFIARLLQSGELKPPFRYMAQVAKATAKALEAERQGSTSNAGGTEPPVKDDTDKTAAFAPVNISSF